jgi:hypothetical protein
MWVGLAPSHFAWLGWIHPVFGWKSSIWSSFLFGGRVHRCGTDAKLAPLALVLSRLHPSTVGGPRISLTFFTLSSSPPCRLPAVSPLTLTAYRLCPHQSLWLALAAPLGRERACLDRWRSPLSTSASGRAQTCLNSPAPPSQVERDHPRTHLGRWHTQGGARVLTASFTGPPLATVEGRPRPDPAGGMLALA